MNISSTITGLQYLITAVVMRTSTSSSGSLCSLRQRETDRIKDHGYLEQFEALRRRGVLRIESRNSRICQVVGSGLSRCAHEQKYGKNIVLMI